MRILVFRYTVRKKNFAAIEHLAAIEPPIWMMLKVQQLRDKGCEVDWFDNELKNLSAPEIVETVASGKYDLIIIFPTGNHPSAHIHQQDGLEDVIKDIRVFTDCHAQYHLDFDPTKINIDWAALDLHKYRAHNWHTWGGKDRSPYGVLFTSIGCPFQCKFCSIKKFYGVNYKTRDMDKIEQDIQQLADNNIRNIKIMDELFFTNNSRFYEICDILRQHNSGFNIWAYARVDTINEHMLHAAAKAGIRWIGLGIESGNPVIRRSMSKGTFTNMQIKDAVKAAWDYGIHVGGNFMFGFPDDDMDTMQETLDLAIDLKCEFSNFYFTVAYPGSELHEFAKQQEWALPESWIGYSQYAYEAFPLRTKYLTNKEVLAFRDWAFTVFYTDPDYLSFMGRTFGQNTVDEITAMTKIPLKRKLLE